MNKLLLLAMLLVPEWCLASSWQIVPSPNRGQLSNVLTSVAAAGDSDVWAVGYGGGAGQSNSTLTLIEHWDGARWTIVPSPNTSRVENLLNGVAVTSSTDVWAVGMAVTRTAFQTLIEHWDGTTWSVVPSPNVVGRANQLLGVTVISSNDVWAVGYSTSEGTNFTLTLHWDGAAWTIVPSSDTAGQFLRVVSGTGAGDVWAVGVTNVNDTPFSLHWDGSQWSPVRITGRFFDDSQLSGVIALGTDDVWVTGNNGSSATLIEHWNGTAFQHVPAQPLNGDQSNAALVSLAARSSSDIWSVGLAFLGFSQQAPLSYHWDGQRWSMISVPTPSNSNTVLAGITATPNGNLWAVGNTAPFTKAERTFILEMKP